MTEMTLTFALVLLHTLHPSDICPTFTAKQKKEVKAAVSDTLVRCDSTKSCLSRDFAEEIASPHRDT